MNSGRNDPCPCASGKKFKKCCGQDGLSSVLRRARPYSYSVVAAPLNHNYAQEEAVNSDEMQRLVALFQAGRFEELESQARDLIKRYPYAGFVWKVLGVALKSQGKDALIALKKATELIPNDAESHCNLALALQDLGQLDAAVASCKRALLINPDYVEAHNNLSNALRELRQLDAAEASCRRALAINPNFAPAHHSLAVLLRNRGCVAQAEISCQRALEIDPHLSGAITFMAELQADKGEFSQAEILFRRAIVITPESPEAWAGIAGVRKMTSADAGWLAEAQRIVAHALPPRSESRLRFAIGKYYDDVRDFEHAFMHYQRANELGKLYGNAYNRQQQTLAVTVLSRIYGREWIRREQIEGSQSARPVFIVGMPRSGTSLAEQILASHPAVFGAGELGFWKSAAATHAPSILTGKIDERAIPKLAGDYAKLLQGFSADALRVVDKMPDNFLHLGLIHAAFPNARVIHMQRNPIDTCLSIYFQHFNTSHTYSNDLEDLAHYYTEYSRVMEHWCATLPSSSILHVPYEGLVDDQEGWSRTMLDFIGLPWDARCIDFHQCVRTVSTASNWQVRQKISKTSVLRWRNYEKFVGPLHKLMDLGHTPGAVQHHLPDASDTMQMLGNILRRAELLLRIDDADMQSPVIDAVGFHARHAAELALAVR
jgi:tetratricopeptide (TPR) repeat protein